MNYLKSNNSIRLNCAIFFIVGLLFLGNCSRKNGESTLSAALNGGLFNILNAFDPAGIFTNLSQNVIGKSYTDLETIARSLKSSTDSYTPACGNTASLLNLQTLWKSNMSALKDTEISQFGPSVQSGYYEIMDPWVNSYLSNPADTASINSYIAGAAAINTSTISALNKLQRGLPAIEYLLFDDGIGNATLTAICNALLANSNRRLTFLTFLVADYYNNASSLNNAWLAGSGNFVSELSLAGRGSSFFETKKFALDTLINQMIGILNTIVDKKLGYPAGLNVSSNGVIRSNNVESRYANVSEANLLQNLRSVQKYYTGNGGAGISDYVKFSNPILDRKITAQLDDAILKTAAITSLKNNLATSNLTSIQEAFAAIRSLRTTFTTELVSLSGTSTSVTTGDGD